MPRTRSKSAKLTESVTRRVNYREDSYLSDNDDDNDDPGLLTNILGILMNMQRRSTQKKNKKKSSSKTPKRKQSVGDCDCTPKRQCTQSRAKGKRKAPTSKFSAANAISIDSEDEMASASITETHVDTIKNKVDNFFKALDSDDDELDAKLSEKNTLTLGQVEKRSKDFYTISDSEDEKEKPCTSADNTNSFSEPSTSGLSNLVISGPEQFSQAVNKEPEKKPEDLFAYVDDILNNCNVVVDITNEKPKENVPVESLEDLKKKTEEILGSVTTLIEDLKPKPKEPEKNKVESPEKQAPSCPVCLEPLVGARHAMSTFCGHIFCKPCISQVARTTKKCPTCRKSITKTKYHQVYI